MNLKQLQTFLTLYEIRSFTGTAKALGMAQSAVTTQIRQLEESLGVRLFERIGKKVTPTAEGETLLFHARQILALSSDIQGLFHTAGRITVGITEDVAAYLMGDILREFKAVHPDTEVFLKLVDGKDYSRMLAEGQIDAAIVLDVAVKSRHLKVLTKRREKIALLAASTHPLAGKHTISSEEFRRTPLILGTAFCPYRRMFEESLTAKGIRPLIALETSSIPVIKESSLCGIGLCLLPEFAVKKELIYHIFEKLNYNPDCPVYTQVIVHQDKWLSKYLDTFLDIAVRHLA